MSIDALVQKSQACLAQRVEIPGAPLWHMGMAAKFGKTESLQLLQNTIDYLTCKGKAGLDFTEDEKEFMKELFEAMWWGGKYLGYKEAATLANHYVNGGGKPIKLSPEVYKTSVIVSDVCAAMKSFVRELYAQKKPILSLKSTGAAFRASQYAKPLMRGRRSANTHGYLLPEGVLLAEQKNARLMKADNRFILQSSTSKTAIGFRTIWQIESIYDFEPFSKNYVTNLNMAPNVTLKIPDGLSEYLTKIGTAKVFKYYVEWHEEWK